LGRLCELFEQWWQQRLVGREQLDQRYQDLLWARGTPTAFELDELPFTGIPQGVDGDGRLRVEGPDGKVKAYGLDRLRFALR